ncbi:MAG: hypothetical protein IMY72_14180 [Bacteroidetes bacterium]|nr:hypothetical protein [Bacteroidota bacterium]
MNKKTKISSACALVLFLIIIPLSKTYAQFYNGLQMSFGKNRVQYIDFYWQYYRFDKFDTYMYVGGKNLAEYTAKYASTRISELEYKLEHTLERRIIFIIYNKHSDFKQSNIGLITGKQEYNIGGQTRIINNKVFLFFEGNHHKYKQQIDAAITEAILRDMLYGGSIKDRLTSTALLNLPSWYEKGLISFYSKKWDLSIENKIRDGILTKKYKKINRLAENDAVYAGHSFWKYISDNYGDAVVSNVVYLTRLSKNVDKGFMFVLGIPLKDLLIDWFEYYKTKFNKENIGKNIPETDKLLKKTKKSRVYKQIKISADDNYIAYTTNEKGKYIVWIYNTQNRKRKRIFSKGSKLEQITDYSYPILTWHPSSEFLSIITEQKGKMFLSYYILNTKKIETQELFYIDKILDFSYSDNGLFFVFSGIKDGHTDIYVHSVAANSNEQITNDVADDLNPKFINNSNDIIFSSNRIEASLPLNIKDSVQTSDFYDLFIYDYKNKSNKLTQLSSTPYANEFKPFEIKKNMFSYLSDENGIINRQLIKFDSTISFIDTSIHYRHFTKKHILSNYSTNVLDYNINKKSGSYAEILFNKNRFHLFTDNLNINENSYSGNYRNTEFRNLFNKYLTNKDSVIEESDYDYYYDQEPDSLVISPKQFSNIDSTFIDINNYLFEFEKEKFFFNIKNSLDIQKDSAGFKLPKQLVYFTNFYTNTLVNQIDFGFLNSSYQAFTGGAVYFNPGFNIFTKIGAVDLFENYKITGGIRFSPDFRSNEYLISLVNLKKQIDKQIIFHRQAFENTSQYFVSKTHSHELIYLLKYPFSQVSALQATETVRYDRTSYLSTDYVNLDRKSDSRIWNGLKIEYIYDNTFNRGVNLFNGTRLKIFGEFYKQIDKEINSNFFVVGADVRNYLKIHRDLIWANRFAASSSFGNSLLIYYLGGVDNWINLSSKVKTFDNSIRIDTDKNYVYQTLATNMRGFTQNIRNGNNFAVINSEIRWPIIKYFANRPLNSGFLNNFMIIGFADIGSAWTGLTPYSNDNAYNQEIITNGPITVIIDKGNDPIVAGYGFGLRTRLLGYYIRADWAWGIENRVILPKIFYLSLNLDF